MPKQVIEKLLSQLEAEIRNGYSPGDRFWKVSEIAQKYQVSLQTAQKAVKALVESNILRSSPRAGIRIHSLRPYRSIAGKKILLLSNLYDRKYDEVFLGEIRKDADAEQVQLIFQKLSEPDYPGLTLGEYIAAQQADGVILLSFTASALSIYHAIREGFDVVSDIHYPELPMLAVVQTDNYKHSYEAGLLMSQKQGRREILALGFQKEEKNIRFHGLQQAVLERGNQVSYCCVTGPQWSQQLDTFLHYWHRNKAVFSADYPSNFILASKLIQHHILIENCNVLMYDNAQERFCFHGLPDIPTVAPSMEVLARELCLTLFHKWKWGDWPVPRQRLV